MLTTSDLDTAVAEGIISQDQALRLRDLARRTANSGPDTLDFTQTTRDEPFRLLRGFRDIFIAIGLVIFAIGFTSVVQALTGADILASVFTDDLSSRITLVVATAILVAGGVALAEWITRYQRLPFASLVLALVIAAWSGLFLTSVGLALWPQVFTNFTYGAEAALWTNLAGAILGLLAFYWRYRLPFTLLPLAGVAVAFVYNLGTAAMGDAWTDTHGRIFFGVLGLAVFAAAMWYDLTDRLRLQRFSECGFWLHLLAAPMIVHSILWNASSDEASDPVLILGTMAVMGLVALLIDRRALLVSGLSYLAFAIWNLISGSAYLADQQFAATASILGAVLLVLGLAWTPIRRTVLRAVPLPQLKAVLPPVAGA